MKRLLLFVPFVLIVIVLVIVLLYGRLRHWDLHAWGIAFGILSGILVLLSWRREKLPPDAKRSRWASAGGRVLIVLGWLAYAAGVGYLGYYLGGHVNTSTFQVVPAVGVVMLTLPQLLVYAGRVLAGFTTEKEDARTAAPEEPFDPGDDPDGLTIKGPTIVDSRLDEKLHDHGWRRTIRSGASVAIKALLAGFANPLAAAASLVGLWVPDHAYHLFHGWFGTNWLATPATIVVGTVWLAVLNGFAYLLRQIVHAILGPDNPISEWLDDHTPSRITARAGDGPNRVTVS